MIVDERMVTYIRSLERPENPVIEAIEQEALDSFVPIIRKETQSFLKVMMLMNRPARVLEVGTAVGFSAILMSEYLPEGSHITTIENYEKRIPIARNNFKRAGKEEQITLIEGDALEVMETLEGPYDFIFMDATPAIAIFVPIVLPAGLALGLHPVHIGMIICLVLALGMVTPPYGLCLLLGCQIAKIEPQKTFKDLFIMLGAVIVVYFIVVLLPDLVLWLPRLLVPKYV